MYLPPDIQTGSRGPGSRGESFELETGGLRQVLLIVAHPHPWFMTTGLVVRLESHACWARELEPSASSRARVRLPFACFARALAAVPGYLWSPAALHR